MGLRQILAQTCQHDRRKLEAAVTTGNVGIDTILNDVVNIVGMHTPEYEGPRKIITFTKAKGDNVKSISSPISNVRKRLVSWVHWAPTRPFAGTRSTVRYLVLRHCHRHLIASP